MDTSPTQTTPTAPCVLMMLPIISFQIFVPLKAQRGFYRIVVARKRYTPSVGFNSRLSPYDQEGALDENGGFEKISSVSFHGHVARRKAPPPAAEEINLGHSLGIHPRRCVRLPFTMDGNVRTFVGFM